MKKSYFLLTVVGLVLVSAIVLRIVSIINDRPKDKLEISKNELALRSEVEGSNILNNQTVKSGEATFANQALVISPKQNEIINSPLIVKGSIIGSWFFEGTLPIKLVDSDNNVIGSGQARADSDWMAEKPVPFSASLEFLTNATSGYLIISKDNPSGLPENDGFIKLPVRFK